MQTDMGDLIAIEMIPAHHAKEAAAVVLTLALLLLLLLQHQITRLLTTATVERVADGLGLGLCSMTSNRCLKVVTGVCKAASSAANAAVAELLKTPRGAPLTWEVALPPAFATAVAVACAPHTFCAPELCLRCRPAACQNTAVSLRKNLLLKPFPPF